MVLGNNFGKMSCASLSNRTAVFLQPLNITSFFDYNMVTELTDTEFQKFISSPKPVIVDFWASWCMPCKMLAPVFEQVSKEFTGKLKFAKLSTEEYPEMAREVSITGIPCMIVFRNGKEVDRIIGFYPAAALKSKIEDILENM